MNRFPDGNFAALSRNSLAVLSIICLIMLLPACGDETSNNDNKDDYKKGVVVIRTEPAAIFNLSQDQPEASPDSLDIQCADLRELIGQYKVYNIKLMFAPFQDEPLLQNYYVLYFDEKYSVKEFADRLAKLDCIVSVEFLPDFSPTY